MGIHTTKSANGYIMKQLLIRVLPEFLINNPDILQIILATFVCLRYTWLFIVLQKRISYLELWHLHACRYTHTYTHMYTYMHTYTQTVNPDINSQIYTTIRVAWLRFEVNFNNPIDHGRCRGLNFYLKSNAIVQKSWQWTTIGMTWSHRKILYHTI